MLNLLHIENIAIIEQADIIFEPGFNALTGETGAGKSIVIDALSAVLGQRTSRDLIRTGSEKALVSACFSGGLPEVAGEYGISGDSELLLQREIYADGRNVCRINGYPATVTQLRTLGTALLNIHGQHDGQQLLDEEQHILYLDSFGCLQPMLERYRQAYRRLTELRGRIRLLQMDEAEKVRRMDTLRYQIAELERAELHSGEEEALFSRRNFLRNSEKFISAVSRADYSLSGDDESSGALQMLRQAQDAISAIRNLDEGYGVILERLSQACSEVYDLAETLRDRRESFEFSPHELDEVEGRLDQLYRLKKKYGPSVEDMLDYLARCRRELEEITEADDTIIELERQCAKAESEARAEAETLSEERRRTAEQLSARIMEELAQLDMGKIRFSVDFAEKELYENGMDAVQFLMSANIGEALKPIHRIASGGELARIMLAMKNVLSEQDHVGTMVFDEVDTGVSGRAAQRVAEKMARISRGKQVMCVTHLPQLAAMADTHFSVEKGERDGRTYTAVTKLDRRQRCAELARLTGGAQVTKTMLSGAEELLRQAEEYRCALEE